MFAEWQTIVVWLIILAALAYVGRRGWARLLSFGAGGKGQGSSTCASGCGSCGDERPEAQTNATRPQNVLVQITNTGSASRRSK